MQYPQAICLIIAVGCSLWGLWSLIGPQEIKPHWSVPVGMLVMGAFVLALGAALPHMSRQGPAIHPAFAKPIQVNEGDVRRSVEKLRDK
jgi:hypothetical protein